MIYEPLFFFNIAKAGTPQPWLAKSYAWSNGGKTITFTMRTNAKWTDGQAVTAADVAYTFNLLKSNPALNSAGLPIDSASAPNATTAVVNFTQSSYAAVDYIAGSTYILPQHVWSKISNPTTTLNPKPVGSGAYTVQSVTGQALTLKANPNYYMAGLPKVKSYRFLYFNGNQAANLAIENGQVDWANTYIPNIDTVYKKKNPKFAVSNTPVAITSLVPNFQDPVVSQLPVRQAISYALDRDTISKTVYNGYANPISTSGLISPNFDNVADPTLKDSKFEFSVSKAKSTLESAGYTMGSDGFFAKDGKELTLTVQVPSGYTDYVQALQIMVQQLKSAGINLVVQGESVNAWTSAFYNGQFQLLMTYQGFTSSPYVYYKTLIGSDGLPPIGQEDTAGNQGRYTNPEVDTLLQQIASTPDVSAQKPSFVQIQQIFARDLPVIPLFQQQNEGTFNGNHITGFPTPDNPYASSGQQQPNVGWVAMHLTPVK
ncbi:peptide ABC transporter substrate-binding protein [Pseudolysinimonas kribbensis]|uniref:Peptide ABC transporter substrate-binding protein n=2 Tax=Pseudolysinimonas kribbensis TaxID=433641 RepID=A0ABQ6K560_9MICO|nr:ABC transporter substrate-binding protein [Pseudolysinimonas kribbensis]GMA94698.1 peptide ABC transporter substrate-binding protein [Pseudolysinimonas kribbensis]